MGWGKKIWSTSQLLCGPFPWLVESKAKPHNEGYEQVMIAIITGASSGIGEEFTKQVDKLGFDEVWLVARREEKLKNLSYKLKTRARIIALDLCKEESILKIKNEIKGKKIGLLINSAGRGTSKYFKESSLDDDMKTLKLNILALVGLTKALLPYFSKNGIILNISSVSAFIPQPKFAVYSASKSFVLSFSRSIRREFKDIRVSVLCPSIVDTEFIEKSDNKSKIKDLGKEDLEKMVKKSIKYMGKKDIITTSPTSKLILLISKIIPHSLIMKIEKLMKIY